MNRSDTATLVANDNLPTIDVVDALINCLEIDRVQVVLVPRQFGASHAIAAAEVRRQFERQMGIAI